MLSELAPEEARGAYMAANGLSFRGAGLMAAGAVTAGVWVPNGLMAAGIAATGAAGIALFYVLFAKMQRTARLSEISRSDHPAAEKQATAGVQA